MKMSVREIAEDLVALCKEGSWEAPVERYYSPDILSVEAQGDEPESRGIEAVRAKGAWWVANFEVHSIGVYGPFVNGAQFAVGFDMDITHKATGKRSKMEEVGLYTVQDDKIVEERFFYGTPE